MVMERASRRRLASTPLRWRTTGLEAVSYLCKRTCRGSLTHSADGFFDAGMLLQALKKKDEPQPVDQIVQKRRAVGKKLALTEY
jgi:hypothetical protein